MAGNPLTGSGFGCNAQEDTRQRVMVIGHRGASALLPEYTLTAYAKAIDDGTDFIDPDLVSGVLLARHENEIGSTTDIALHEEFALRRVKKVVDGKAVEGWFTEDFTLKELKTLVRGRGCQSKEPGQTTENTGLRRLGKSSTCWTKERERQAGSSVLFLRSSIRAIFPD